MVRQGFLKLHIVSFTHVHIMIGDYMKREERERKSKTM